MNFGDVRDSYFTAISQFTVDLVTFTEGILNEKLHFLCSVKYHTLLHSCSSEASNAISNGKL